VYVRARVHVYVCVHVGKYSQFVHTSSNRDTDHIDSDE
jgi:hypothetical protein